MFVVLVPAGIGTVLLGALYLLGLWGVISIAPTVFTVLFYVLLVFACLFLILMACLISLIFPPTWVKITFVIAATVGIIYGAYYANLRLFHPKEYDDMKTNATVITGVDAYLKPNQEIANICYKKFGSDKWEACAYYIPETYYSPVLKPWETYETSYGGNYAKPGIPYTKWRKDYKYQEICFNIPEDCKSLLLYYRERKTDPKTNVTNFYGYYREYPIDYTNCYDDTLFKQTHDYTDSHLSFFFDGETGDFFQYTSKNITGYLKRVFTKKDRYGNETWYAQKLTIAKR